MLHSTSFLLFVGTKAYVSFSIVPNRLDLNCNFELEEDSSVHTECFSVLASKQTEVRGK